MLGAEQQSTEKLADLLQCNWLVLLGKDVRDMQLQENTEARTHPLALDS